MEGRKGGNKGKGIMEGSSTQPSKKSKTSSSHVNVKIDTMGIVFARTSERTKFGWLSGRDIKPTQFPSYDAMLTLGIYDNIMGLHQQQNSGHFTGLGAYTFRKLTLEFLSTVKKVSRRVVDGEAGLEGESIELQFRFMNTPFTLDLEEINEILGWPNQNSVTNEYPLHFNPDVFWEQLTGEPRFITKRAKASQIIHPVLRYIHRMYSCAIFAKEEKGAMNKSELFLLWAFVTGYTRVNIGRWVIERIEEQISQETGDIHVGGIITLFAAYHHFQATEENMKDWIKVDGSSSLDLAALRGCSMISGNLGGHYAFYVGRNRIPYINLPNPNLPIVILNQPQTWTFPLNLGQNEEVEEEEEEQAQNHPFNQMPPDFYQQFNNLVINQNQLLQQNNQILNQLGQFSQNFNQFQANMDGRVGNIEGRVGHLEGRVNQIFDYGVDHWGFPPPPPPFQ